MEEGELEEDDDRAIATLRREERVVATIIQQKQPTMKRRNEERAFGLRLRLGMRCFHAFVVVFVMVVVFKHENLSC